LGGIALAFLLSEVVTMDWPVDSVGWDIQEFWVVSAANTLAWGILASGAVAATILLLAMLAIRNKRRRFWCNGAHRDVEVEFEERGLPGFRKTSVLSCSVFDPPTAVRCHRNCLDPEQRVRVPIAPRLSWTRP
jgi:hypothetical protein